MNNNIFKRNLSKGYMNEKKDNSIKTYWDDNCKKAALKLF